jgi:hypothetical protein
VQFYEPFPDAHPFPEYKREYLQIRILIWATRLRAPSLDLRNTGYTLLNTIQKRFDVKRFRQPLAAFLNRDAISFMPAAEFLFVAFLQRVEGGAEHVFLILENALAEIGLHADANVGWELEIHAFDSLIPSIPRWVDLRQTGLLSGTSSQAVGSMRKGYSALDGQS